MMFWVNRRFLLQKFWFSSGSLRDFCVWTLDEDPPSPLKGDPLTPLKLLKKLPSFSHMPPLGARTALTYTRHLLVPKCLCTLAARRTLPRTPLRQAPGSVSSQSPVISPGRRTVPLLVCPNSLSGDREKPPQSHSFHLTPAAPRSAARRSPTRSRSRCTARRPAPRARTRRW